jgi:hypothetical protein
MSSGEAKTELVEGVDFYREGTAMVFTETYHLRRGYCCESGCRHCPYGYVPREESGRASAGGAREALKERRG